MTRSPSVHYVFVGCVLSGCVPWKWPRPLDTETAQEVWRHVPLASIWVSYGASICPFSVVINVIDKDITMISVWLKTVECCTSFNRVSFHFYHRHCNRCLEVNLNILKLMHRNVHVTFGSCLLHFWYLLRLILNETLHAFSNHDNDIVREMVHPISLCCHCHVRSKNAGHWFLLILTCFSWKFLTRKEQHLWSSH